MSTATRGLLAVLALLCTLIGGVLGYLVSARFIKVEQRIETSEVEIGVLKVRVEILEGGNARIDVPIDKERLQRLVMQEIRDQLAHPQEQP